MNFCVIAPAVALQTYATLSKRHLVLSHVRNAVYREFYRLRREAGDLLILDNGAYENRLNEDELVETIKFYNPQVVVLPDILLGDAHESLQRGFEFFVKWRHRIDVEWMFVPQAPVDMLHDFMSYLVKGIDMIEPKWVGLPRALGTDIAVGNVRADVCSFVRRTYPGTYVHALGMVDGDVGELRSLRDASCDSIDSSAPVWRGWRGFSIDDDRWHGLGSSCNFNAAPCAAKFERLIESNLKKCGVRSGND
jgi:hypothetical protein